MWAKGPFLPKCAFPQQLGRKTDRPMGEPKPIACCRITERRTIFAPTYLPSLPSLPASHSRARSPVAPQLGHSGDGECLRQVERLHREKEGVAKKFASERLEITPTDVEMRDCFANELLHSVTKCHPKSTLLILA